MNLVHWSPFRDLEGVFDSYNRILGMRDFANQDSDIMEMNVNWRPVADIIEKKKEYIIKAELPEVEKDDVTIEIDDGTLTISGERRMEKEEDTEKQHRIERFYGKFLRSFSIPSDVDADAISAKSRNGVLKVSLPKIKKAEAKPIEVKVE